MKTCYILLFSDEKFLFDENHKFKPGIIELFKKALERKESILEIAIVSNREDLRQIVQNETKFDKEQMSHFWCVTSADDYFANFVWSNPTLIPPYAIKLDIVLDEKVKNTLNYFKELALPILNRKNIKLSTTTIGADLKESQLILKPKASFSSITETLNAIDEWNTRGSVTRGDTSIPKQTSPSESSSKEFSLFQQAKLPEEESVFGIMAPYFDNRN